MSSDGVAGAGQARSRGLGVWPPSGGGERSPLALAEVNSIDSGVDRGVTLTADTLSGLASKIGVTRIREAKDMQPAMKSAFTLLWGNRVVREKKLLFPDWSGVENRNVGGIDLAVKRPRGSGWTAFIELKWCPADGLYLGWAIWDIYKMMSGRFSPGADACYVIAGAPDELWTRSDTVGDLFRSDRWSTEEVMARFEPIFVNGDDCKKLVRLAGEFETVLVANKSLRPPHDEWRMKAIRVEPDTTGWIYAIDGQAAFRLHANGDFDAERSRVTVRPRARSQRELTAP